MRRCALPARGRCLTRPRCSRLAAACAGLALLTAGPAAAQRLDRPLRVYLDCSGFRCDADFFVQEVPWVDFVRDRQDADVHVLGTSQATGAGGSAYTLDFRGRGAFDGQRLTLGAAAAPDATEADRRTALLAVVRLGLAPFATHAPDPPTVEVRSPEPGGETSSAQQHDPWNRWTFRVGVDGFMHGESRQRGLAASGSASASRVTNEWKTQFSVRGSRNSTHFELNDSTTFTSATESYTLGALVARSVAGHWGAGAIAEWRRSTFTNYDASIVVGPALEYNVFPYAESTRRLLTILYAIGPRYNDYRKLTIFDESAEAIVEQLLVVSYDVTQPWGSVDISAQASHYLAKWGDGDPWTRPQYSGELFGGFDLRLFRGLSARLNGSLGLVRNQIQLAAAGLTEEEILTRQRELATNYRYFTSFGLSYRFGSIFSQVVNPRFRALD